MTREIQFISKSIAGLMACVALFILPLGGTAEAQVTNTAPSNRWLLIMQTSRSMQSRAEAGRRLIANLVASEMNGQAHAGDTLGLWTFNDELHTVFPLQELTGKNGSQVAGRIYQFLSAQKNEKDSNPEKVSPELLEVVKDSDFITIILVTDGSRGRLGTPFDDRIQSSYREWSAQQQQNQMPFVTVLRAKAGKFTDFLVNTPPFPLELPELPEELQKLRIAAEKKPEQKPEQPKPAPVTLPPLIISGKKPESPVNTNTTPAPAIAESTPKTNAIPSVSTNVAAMETNRVIVATKEPIEPAVPEETNSAAETASVESQEASTVAAAQTVQSSTVTTEKKSFAVVWIVSAGAVLLLAVGAIAFSRRNRGTRTSLITRSLDREQRH